MLKTKFNFEKDPKQFEIFSLLCKNKYFEINTI